MDKINLRLALEVLETVKTKYGETKYLIEDECQKEKISMEEVIFSSLEAKSYPRKTFFILQ